MLYEPLTLRGKRIDNNVRFASEKANPSLNQTLHTTDVACESL